MPECPKCHADLSCDGSVNAVETHVIRGRVRFDADQERFTNLPIYSDGGFDAIDGDEVPVVFHACGSCGTEVTELVLTPDGGVG